MIEPTFQIEMVTEEGDTEYARVALQVDHIGGEPSNGLNLDIRLIDRGEGQFAGNIIVDLNIPRAIEVAREERAVEDGDEEDDA